MRPAVKVMLPLLNLICIPNISHATASLSLVDDVNQFFCTTDQQVGFFNGKSTGVYYPSFKYVIERNGKSNWTMKSLDQKTERIQCEFEDVDQIYCTKKIAYDFSSFILSIDIIDQRLKANFSYYKHSGFPSVSSSSIEEGSCLTN